MPDPISAATFGVTAFAHLRQLAKSLSELRTEAEIAAKVSELNLAILDAQGTALDLQQALADERETVVRLRAELQAHADWAATLAKYEFVEAGVGQRLWRCKEGANPHYICPNCVIERIESPLQTAGQQSEKLWCPKCDKHYPMKLWQRQPPIAYKPAGWPGY